MAFLFEGDERSYIEYFQLAVLAALWASVLVWAWKRRHVGDAVSIILWISAAALFLLLGREFSYGKYHGVPRDIRKILRYTSFALVALGLGRLAYHTWPHRVTLWRELKTLASSQKSFIAFMFVVTAISQVVDKDLLFTIQPPLLAQALEEVMESVVHIVFGLFLWRVHASQPFEPTPKANLKP